MKKRILEAELSYEFSLLGIIAQVKEYKLAWNLNNTLGVTLDKAGDITIEFLKNQTLVISNFCYETENNLMRLLKNKSVESHGNKTVFLIPELSRFDYFLIIQGFEDDLTVSEMKEKVAGIPGVQFVQEIPVDKLKSKENLIF